MAHRGENVVQMGFDRVINHENVSFTLKMVQLRKFFRLRYEKHDKRSRQMVLIQDESFTITRNNAMSRSALSSRHRR